MSGNNSQGDGVRGNYFSTIPNFTSLQLDIVGFLAILGEGSVLANAQVATLSKWIMIPRLLPAPQALLRPSRPTRLDPAVGRVTGVVSGNNRDSLNHIGSIILDADSMKEFDVRCVEIERDDNAPIVKARTVGWLTFNAILGSVFAVAIFILSTIWEDGMGMIATLSLSFLSTIIGIGNRWTLKLPKRGDKSKHVPPGDVVIRHPKGSFLVVKCSEDIAREIFFAPENIEYLVSDEATYRLLSLMGSMLLMAGVICLANAQVKTQTCFAAAYMILNASYWVVAAFPDRVHWNTTAFRVKPQRLETAEWSKNIDHNTSYTKALFKAIVAARGTDWVQLGDAAPRTKAWDEWLREARRMAESVDPIDPIDDPNNTGMTVYRVPDWDPQGEFNECLVRQGSAEEMV